MILLSFHFDITVNDITVNLYSCCCFIINLILRGVKLSYLSQISHSAEMFTTIFITPPPKGCNKNKVTPIGQGEHCIAPPPHFSPPPHPTPPYSINNERSLTGPDLGMGKTTCFNMT